MTPHALGNLLKALGPANATAPLVLASGIVAAAFTPQELAEMRALHDRLERVATYHVERQRALVAPAIRQQPTIILPPLERPQ